MLPRLLLLPLGKMFLEQLDNFTLIQSPNGAVVVPHMVQNRELLIITQLLYG